MSNDVVDRLRADGAMPAGFGPRAIQREAADEIERLRAECQRLAGEVSRAHKDALTWMERAAAANAERDAARAEAARLREALQQMAALFEQIMEAIGADPEETRMNVRRQPSGEAIASISVADCFRNARAALAAKEPGHDR